MVRSAKGIENASLGRNIEEVLPTTVAGADKLTQTCNSREIVSMREFVAAIKDKAITLAHDDGDVHRLFFTTNDYGITTAALYRARTSGSQTSYELLAEPLRLANNERGILSLVAPSESGVGAYKYPLIICLPMTVAFLESGRAQIHANLRSSHATTWEAMPQHFKGFIETKPRP